MTKIQALWVVTLCRRASGSRRFENSALETSSGTTATQHHIPKDLNLQQYGCDNLIVASVMFQSHGLGVTAHFYQKDNVIFTVQTSNLILTEVHKSRAPERLNTVPW